MPKIRKIKKIINGVVAITIGYAPVLFPYEGIILTMVILGQIFTAIIIYALLEALTNIKD